MTPPRVPRALLAWIVGRRDREFLLNDLDEEFAEICRTRGRRAASLWYWRQGITSVTPLVISRLSQRSNRVSRQRLLMNVNASWLDFKRGLRMLVKHPVLTIIGTVATTFAIAAGGVYFEVANDFLHPTLPLEDGDRVIAIQNQDLKAAATARRSLHDFAVWRSELRSVEDLAAYTVYDRNLAVDDAQTGPVQVVEISAAAFRVARIQPLLGRALRDADEEAGAAPVVVIGERLWASRFNRDPGIVGDTVDLGASRRTVVGVMPAAFALPVNHSVWVPFQRDPAQYTRGTGPSIGTIGRLAPGVTLQQAQAQLTVIGQRIATEFPDTNAYVHPRISPYLAQFTADGSERSLRVGLNAIFVMLLIVLCANVGALVFARLAARERELTVRTALGASRRRIVMQMFVESFVLTSISAVVALAVLRLGLERVAAFFWAVQGEARPFWHSDDLNTTTVLYLGTLAVVGAFVTGVLPALKFTKGGVEASLRRTSMGGAGMHSRKMSTAVVVFQVALSGALLPIAISATFNVNWSAAVVRGIDTGEYLTVRYRIEGGEIEGTHQQLKSRLLAESGIAGVTVTTHLPGSTHLSRLVELDVDQHAQPASEMHRVKVASVDHDFFDVFSLPLLAGRGFQAADLVSGPDVVIVNEPFVRSVLGGRNAIGRRLRYVGDDGEAADRWFEIVGVVPDGGMNPLQPTKSSGVYHLAALREMQSGFMALRVGPDAAAFSQKVQSIAAAVDPGLLIYDTRPLDEISGSELQLDRAFALASCLAIYLIVLLSAAVTFALMSFTVSQRTREIGIRKSLGAGPRSVIVAVFSRAFVQLGLGAALGAFASITAFSQLPNSRMDPDLILIMTAFMLLVGLLSCGAPAMRALRVPPTEAMRENL